MAGVRRLAAGLGAHLGIPASQAELAASLSPADYVYATPSLATLERLQRQRAGPPRAPGAGPIAQPAATAGAGAGFGPAGALQGAAAAAAAPKLEDLYTGVHHHHHPALDMDDDCLQLLLGEDEPPASARSAAAAPTHAPAAAPAGPKAAGSANGSEKSSACHAEEAAAGTEGEAASHRGAAPQGEEEDDIAMLFHAAPHLHRHASAPTPLEPLDLHLLGTAPLPAADDGDAVSAAGGAPGCAREAAAAAGAGLKRACAEGEGCEGLSSPPGRGLMLHMNYEKAAESISLDLLAGRNKALCTLDTSGFDPLLISPLPDLTRLGCDTPDTPDYLAHSSDSMPPSLSASLARQESVGKRKRVVAAQ